MKKTYLIDSENINDVWVEILDALEMEDCIMVFFTDKSAHMGYDRIVRLMNQEKGTVKWIRCFGGQNALDFQLVTELGHQICQDQEREYVIVSNDTGYDAAVRYWQQRGCSVSRIKGVECTKLALRMKKQRQAEKDKEEKNREEKNREVREVPPAEEPAMPEKPADQRLDGVLNGTITDQDIVEEEVEKAIKLLFDPAFLREDSSENSEENCKSETESDLELEMQTDPADNDENDKNLNRKCNRNLQKERKEKESQKENIRKKKKKTKSSAVLAKTLFDKVATPERKAQVESLTGTAKTALGAVFESASEIIAEQIAEKAVAKNSKNSRNVKSESVSKNPEMENQKEQKNQEIQENEYTGDLKDLEGYPELEDERDLNYDPDDDSDMDINLDADTNSVNEESREIPEPSTSENYVISEKQAETPAEIPAEAVTQKKGKNEETARKEELSLKTERPAQINKIEREIEKNEDEEAQRMASYSSCQRSLLRIFRASGSADSHADLRFFMDLCRTIKLSNMPLVHNALEYQFGQAVGNSLYRYLKENPESREELSAGYSNNKKQREREYLNLTLKRNHGDIQEETMEAIWKILSALPRKNLSGIHTALVKKFGQKDGSSYYAGIRSHVRIIRSL